MRPPRVVGAIKLATFPSITVKLYVPAILLRDCACCPAMNAMQTLCLLVRSFVGLSVSAIVCLAAERRTSVTPYVCILTIKGV